MAYPLKRKHGSGKLIESLYSIVLQIWETETVPKDWKDAGIVPIFKKVVKQIVETIEESLLSTAGKILACILLNRLREYTSVQMSYL